MAPVIGLGIKKARLSVPGELVQEAATALSERQAQYSFLGNCMARMRL